MAGDQEIRSTRLESELYFECFWYEDAWEELDALAARGPALVKADPLVHNLKGWSIVDRLLIHATRIKRLIDPGDSPGPRESRESWGERVQFAREVARRINPGLLESKELGQARNIVEHANEYLYAFSLRHPQRDIAVFSMEWGDGAVQGKPAHPRFRYYRHLTGDCLVFGHPVNLRRALGVIRELRIRIHPHVDSELFEQPPPDGNPKAPPPEYA